MPAARRAPAPDSGRRTTVRALRARCRALAEALAPSCDAAELAAIRPGGAENPYTGLDGLVEQYAQLVRLSGRPVGDERPTGPESLAGDAVIEAARANTPVAVVTADGETRFVYAKSYHALRWLDGLDQHLVDVLAQLEDVADDVKAALYGRLFASYHVRVWAWILTHPSAGLPFRETDGDPVPPAWTEHLMAEDLLAVWRAHHQVNGTDLQRIAAMFPPPSRASGGRFTLGSFLGGLAHEWGVRVGRLMRRWPLRELFAQAVDAARANAAARESAKPPGRD